MQKPQETLAARPEGCRALHALQEQDNLWPRARKSPFASAAPQAAQADLRLSHCWRHGEWVKDGCAEIGRFIAADAQP